MLNKIMLSLILFLFVTTVPAFAKNETFDIFTYKAPAGYEKDTSKDGMVTYTKIKGNRFCMIGIYQSRQSSGNSAQDFENEWNELVAKPFGIGDGKVIKEDNDSGWDIMLKADKAQTEGTGEFYVALTSFSGHGRVSSVIINYNDESMFEKDIDNFFNNFDTVENFGKKQPVASNNTANAAPLSGSNPSLKGGKITGVWIGLVQGGLVFNTTTGKYKTYDSTDVLRYVPYWKVFFSDGTCTNGLPTGGLYNTPKASDWSGQYTISGNTVTIKYSPDSAGVRMTLLSADQMKDDGKTIYYKCGSVDGLKLDGIWGEYMTTSPPQNDSSITPAIKFSKNGTFRDYGIFANMADPYGIPEHAPGYGTYQIRDFSLILNYSDGRVTQQSFCQYKTVSPTNSTIFINMKPKSKIK